MVGEEAESSNSEGEDESDDEGKKRMELDEGVLRLEGGSNDDDLDSVYGLFHWQMEDYELFPSCNMLRVDEKGEENECLKEYREAEEGKAVTAEAKGKNIPYEPIKKRFHHTVHGEWTAQKKKVTPHHEISRKVSAARKTHRTVCTRNKEEGLNKNFSSTE